MLYHRDIEMLDNRLLKQFREKYKGALLADLLGEYGEGKNVKEVDPFWRDEVQIVTKIEESLKVFLSES